MRYLMLMVIILCALGATLSGCTTVPSTGRKLLMGVVPVPFTASSPGEDMVANTGAALMIEQLAPLQWIAVVLIVGGAFMWFLTSGKTGIGKFSVALGIGLSTFALVMPKIAGWIGLVAVITIIGVVGYVLYDFWRKKRRVKNGLPPMA